MWRALVGALSLSMTRRLWGRLWRDRLTPWGRMLLLGTILPCVLGLSSIKVPIFHIACFLLAFWIVALVAGWLLRPRVRLRGEIPAKATVGEPLEATFDIENHGRWLPAADLHVALSARNPAVTEMTGFEPSPTIEPGETARTHLRLMPHRRGMHLLAPPAVYTTYPFGLSRTKGRHLSPSRPQQMLVQPAFYPLDGVDVPIGSRYQPGGIALTSSIGESPEFIGNREYRYGDPLHQIDWRSWARIAKPVVREYQEEYYCRIALVLDTYVPPGRKETEAGFADLEAGVSLSAAIADALGHGEYIIDLFAAGPELYVFRSGRHTAHFEQVMEILACVTACRERPFERIAPELADELGNISAVICVFLDWDESRRMLVQAAAEAGCSVKMLVVREGETTDPLESAAAWTSRPAQQLTPEDATRTGLGVL